jgi:hypothetical protein
METNCCGFSFVVSWARILPDGSARARMAANTIENSRYLIFPRVGFIEIPFNVYTIY